LHLVSEIDRGAALGDLDMTPTAQRLDCRERVAGAVAMVNEPTSQH
jgi:hypothetical protein